jgi:hypothetical protein
VLRERGREENREKKIENRVSRIEVRVWILEYGD